MITLKGCFVALITPFDGKNQVNYSKIEELVELHIKWGTKGIVPVGTTGETPALTREEQKNVIECVVKAAQKRIPVIAGTGSNCTRTAVEMTGFAQEAGADGALVVLPYYNKPSQAGIKAHVKELDRIGLPLILYNIPGRTGINLLPGTLNDILSECANVIGLKESSGSLDQISEISCGVREGFAILSGDDSLTLPIMSVGGRGVISVAANFIPHLIQEMIDSFFAGKISQALAMHKNIYPLCKALLTLDTSPVPVKRAMNLLGYDVGGVRLPLAGLDAPKVEILKALLAKYGLSRK